MRETRISKFLVLLFAAPAAPYCLSQQTPKQQVSVAIRQTSPKPLFVARLHNGSGKTLYFDFGAQYQAGHAMQLIQISLTDPTGKTNVLGVC